MDLLCGGCGRTLSVDDSAAGSELRCTHCGRAIHVPVDEHPTNTQAQELLAPLDEEEHLADEFLTKARLALKKKLLIVCGSCNERLTVEQRLAGKVARCPACGEQIRIPAPSVYEEPLDAEQLMAEAGEPKESLDVSEPSLPRAGQPTQAEVSQLPPAAPHRPPPLAVEAEPAEPTADQSPSPPPPRPTRIRRARARTKRGIQLRSLVVSLILAAALAGLAGAVAGYFLGRPDGTPEGSPTNGPQAKSPPLQPGKVRPAPAPAPEGLAPPGAALPTGVTGQGPAPPGSPASLAITAVRLTPLGGDGFVPAPLEQAFLEVTVSMTVQGQLARLAVPGRDVSLHTSAGTTPALGLAAHDLAVPLAARAASVDLSPGSPREQTFVFLVPAAFAEGALEVKGVGTAGLPPLPHPPPPSAMSLVGEYVEAGRHLRISFEDPIMEGLRAGPAHRMAVTAEDGTFPVAITPGPLKGLARPLGDGEYELTLASNGRRLDGHLRLLEGEKRLVLYLADRPYHQIIFQKQ